VAARYAATVGLGTKVNIIRGYLGQDVDQDVLAGCDVVFSCVDAHMPRALLNRLSYEKAVLLFDMGSAFRVHEDTVTAGSGRVVIIGPGPQSSNFCALSPNSRVLTILLCGLDSTSRPELSVGIVFLGCLVAGDGACRFQIMRSHLTKAPLAVVEGSASRAKIQYRPVHADFVRYEPTLGRL